MPQDRFSGLFFNVIALFGYIGPRLVGARVAELLALPAGGDVDARRERLGDRRSAMRLRLAGVMTLLPNRQ